MVWVIAEKGQNKFPPQSLALSSSPHCSSDRPTSLGHLPAFTFPPLLSCCGISHDKADFLVHPPPGLALNRSSLFSSKETLAKEHISYFPFSSPLPAPDLSPPSSSLCHLMLPSPLAPFLLTLPLASGSPSHSPSTF